MKNNRLLLPICWLAIACSSGAGSSRPARTARDTLLSDTDRRILITESLSGIIPDSVRQMEFAVVMVLPLEASCPSCRVKTIDSIVAFRHHFPAHHFIVLSADAGMKTMSSYFKGAGHPGIPDIPGVLLFDSTGMARKKHLFNDNPAIYFLAGGKVYRKIDALPHTIKEDLREFFRGYRFK
ncbi:hypothetical protein [Chitinophaga caseinilytica]|uniref:Thioredoxin domain-containing protein n=1 Tax=Chitinophaga caseinilytica TaxID=2267521 RepID=A0ABZ2Z3Z1_9BACT